MIVNAEIRTSISFTFWKGLTLFWKRHSTLLSHTIRRVTRDRLGRGRQYRVGIGVLIDKANQKLRKKLKSSRGAYSSSRLCSDVDRSPEILHRKSTRHDSSICRATRLRDRARLRGFRPQRFKNGRS